MTFLNSTTLFLLAVIPLAAAFLIWRSRVRAAMLRRLGDTNLTQMLYAQISPARRVTKALLWLVTVAALIVAFARPTWGVNADRIEAQGASIYVLLDVSRSMDAQDIVPSRLDRAKFAIRDLFNGLEGNEIGLILFAGHPFIQFPLTVDSRSAVTFVNAASSASITRQGTDIERAISLAIEGFEGRGRASRFIVIMSDGEDFEGDATAAARAAAERDIVIHAIGFGEMEGEEIPLYDETGNRVGFKTADDGSLVLTALDETMLQGLAAATGGIYRRATAGGEEIAELIDRITQAEAGTLGTRVETRAIERFGLFVALALLALSLEILLPETREETAL